MLEQKFLRLGRRPATPFLRVTSEHSLVMIPFVDAIDNRQQESNRSLPRPHSGRDAGIQAMEGKLAYSTVCLPGTTDLRIRCPTTGLHRTAASKGLSARHLEHTNVAAKRSA